MKLNLPIEWAEIITLDAFSQISTTGKKVKTAECNQTGKYPVIDQGQLAISGYIDDPSKLITIKNPIILFGDHTRAIKWINFDFVPGADGTKLLETRSFIEPRFAFFQLQSLEIPDKGYSRHFKYLKEIAFKIPPLAEQKVIADKLDELLAQVDTLKARLDAIPTILKRFRQSVLAAAVSGKLTEEWRGAVEYKRDVTTLAHFTDIDIGHAFKSKEFTENGIRLLRGQNIEPGALRWKETKFFPEEKAGAFEHLRLIAGDIILAMDRPIVAAGLKLARVKSEDLPCLLVQRVARFKNFRGLNTNFLMLVLEDPSFSNYLIPNQTGSDIPHISGKQILSYPVSIPNLEEQAEIARRVEQQFSYADQVEQQVKNAQTKVNQLTQSILAKAFRGELTEQWRQDNPELISGENSPAALLERIKIEREHQKKTPKPKPKPRMAKKKAGSVMSKQITKVIEALRLADAPLNGQQLLAAAGYPVDSTVEQLETFFLDIRETLLIEKSIVKLERSEDGQDWFALKETHKNR